MGRIRLLYPLCIRPVALLVHHGVQQSEQLLKLNETAISQMKSLLTDKNVKRLK
jgi:hypothetical protein